MRCDDPGCSILIDKTDGSRFSKKLCNVVVNIPNFILYLLFMPLGSKIKEITGYDVMSIDLIDMVKQISVPAYFIVTEDDKVSGKADVIALHANYGGKSVFMEAQKKMLKIDQGEHNSERSIMTIKECVQFLNDNFASRIEQGLHHMGHLSQPTHREEKIDSTQELSSVGDIKSSDRMEHKSLLDMLQDSQRNTAYQKIQIAPRLRLLSGSNRDVAPEELDGQKIGEKDLDESMMEFSQQVEDLMNHNHTEHIGISMKNAPIIKLKSLSERSGTHVGGITSPEPLNIKCMEDGIMSDWKIITPFAIQTKASKQ